MTIEKIKAKLIYGEYQDIEQFYNIPEKLINYEEAKNIAEEILKTDANNKVAQDIIKL